MRQMTHGQGNSLVNSITGLKMLILHEKARNVRTFISANLIGVGDK